MAKEAKEINQSEQVEQIDVRIPMLDDDGVTREREFLYVPEKRTLVMKESGREFIVITPPGYKNELTSNDFSPIKVRAIGEQGRIAGFYDHIRWYGGNVFQIRPIFTKRVNPKSRRPYIHPKTNQPMIDPITGQVMLDVKSGAKPVDAVIIPKAQIGMWMEEVDAKERTTKPQTFRQVGMGDARRVKAQERMTQNDSRNVL